MVDERAQPVAIKRMRAFLPCYERKSSMENARGALFSVAAGVLLTFMVVPAGGAALRESVTVDEVAHIGAGLSYLQRLDLRLNEERPPLPNVLAALPRNSFNSFCYQIRCGEELKVT